MQLMVLQGVVAEQDGGAGSSGSFCGSEAVAPDPGGSGVGEQERFIANILPAIRVENAVRGEVGTLIAAREDVRCVAEIAQDGDEGEHGRCFSRAADGGVADGDDGQWRTFGRGECRIRGSAEAVEQRERGK